MRLARGGGAPLVIGHRGAAAVAPENSLEALRAGVEAGADVIEFDIGPGLVVAHSAHEAPARTLTLEEALAYLAAEPVGLHLDVKERGYELEVVAAIQEHDLLGRAFVSTAWASSSRAFAALAPALPRALGYPRDRYGVSRVRWPQPAVAAGACVLRRAMPLRLPVLLAAARADVLSLHHTLCSEAAVAAAHRRGVPVLAWTVNDPETVRRVVAAGVDAVVSDDPAMARRSLAEDGTATLPAP